MTNIIIILKKFWKLPVVIFYYVFDLCLYYYYQKYRLFPGWGIHLYTGKFGQGKTSMMTMRAYEYAVKYPQLNILTNVELKNFPEHTRIIPLKEAKDILNAPKNTLVLIDEIGTLFNSRDFSTGKNSVPKPVFQHLCQCRKRHMMIMATVQRFNLLDKQIRDITATVKTCSAIGKYPFTRLYTIVTYSIDEYEAYTANKMYNPSPSYSEVVIQKEQYRHLYDTTELIQGLLTADYLSDEEILRNQGITAEFMDGSKEGQRAYRKAVKRRR
ncbi:zonular occludens toxin domain-containing protein [Ruminococcus sp.]|uniref:zonular occludens toxin domain-containing protein n=1 Tax=Ruminococcus sp. TaxID=41978 RepID=UPI0025EE659D|nr:zonular occludens toxin domain-containing protein [Ruminococcus sp.]MCR4640169.1 zonular occludens toxin domain-containing protein [Ruminococcus sp.]